MKKKGTKLLKKINSFPVDWAFAETGFWWEKATFGQGLRLASIECALFMYCLVFRIYISLEGPGFVGGQF